MPSRRRRESARSRAMAGAWFGDLVFGGLLEATYVVRRCLKHSLESTDVEDSKSYATVDYTDPIKSIVDGLSRACQKPEHRVRSRIYDDSDSSDDDSDEQVQLLPRDFECTIVKMRPVIGWRYLSRFRNR